MPDEWLFYKGQPLSPDYIGDQQLRSEFLRGWVQQQINQFNATNGNGGGGR